MKLESNEQLIARKEIKSAIEVLLQACQKHNAAFIGFAYSVDPLFIIRFGNITETNHAFFDLLARMERMTMASQRAGNMVDDPLDQGAN